MPNASYLSDDDVAILQELVRWYIALKQGGIKGGTVGPFGITIPQPSNNSNAGRQIPSVLVKVTGNASGGGKYTGRIMKDFSDAQASGNLQMPEGMIPGSEDDCLILCSAEDKTSQHSLANDSYHIGRVVGATTDDGKTIVIIEGIAVSFGTNQYQTFVMTSANQAGWDFCRAHP